MPTSPAASHGSSSLPFDTLHKSQALEQRRRRIICWMNLVLARPVITYYYISPCEVEGSGSFPSWGVCVLASAWAASRRHFPPGRGSGVGDLGGSWDENWHTWQLQWPDKHMWILWIFSPEWTAGLVHARKIRNLEYFYLYPENHKV